MTHIWYLRKCLILVPRWKAPWPAKCWVSPSWYRDMRTIVRIEQSCGRFAGSWCVVVPCSHSCICCNLASSSPFRSLLRHPDESCWGAECNCQVSAVLFVCNLLLAIPSYCSTLFKDRLGRISKGLMTLSKTKNGCFSSQTCQVQKSNHQMIKAIQWISFYPRVWSSRLLPPWRLKTLRRSWPKTPCFMRAASSSGGPRGKAIR